MADEGEFPKVDGDVLYGVEASLFWEGVTCAGLNLIRQIQDRSVDFSAGSMDWWADAYTDSTGRLNSVSVSTTNAIFDTSKYKTPSSYVVIEATSISDEADFAINNCKIVEVSSGVFVLVSTSTDAEVARAEIYKTLFYGSDGTNPRASSTYITGITAIKTNVTRDVGKQAHYAKLSASGVGANAYYDGTFVNTSTNDDCSSWSKLVTSDPGAGDGLCYWEFPESTVVNSATSNTSNELGTDTTGDENSNPADCQLWVTDNSGDPLPASYAEAIILCEGDITWSETVGYPTQSATNTDFLTDNGIPAFTAITTGTEFIIDHDIPTGTFNSTVGTAFLVPLIEDWETGAGIKFKIKNATEDSGWFDVDNNPGVAVFTPLTSEPTKLQIKLVLKTSSPTEGYPSIKGFAMRAW